jgi:methylated-DNA-protein-cysteine methyltransferase related protein
MTKAGSPCAGDNAFERIYAIVCQIPSGRVATYGQIARLAGLPGRARQVGYALAALPAGRDVPWHRVVNARGGISARADPLFEGIQRDLLEHEGVVFGVDGRIMGIKGGQSRLIPNGPGHPAVLRSNDSDPL